jgi:hypothetical protein
MRIEKALDSGQITLADSIAVERCRNLKQAEQILAYRIKKNLEQQAAEKEKLAMLNAQAGAEAAKMAEEERRKTIQMEAEFKLMEIEAKKKADMELKILEYTLKAGLEQNAQRNKLDVTSTTTEAMKEVARIKGEVEKEKAKEKEKEKKKSVTA